MGDRGVGEVPRAFEVLREQFGFVPRLFRAQAALPRLLEAEANLLGAILFDDPASRAQKERLLLASAASHGSVYCATLHYRTLLALGAEESELDRITARGATDSVPEDGLVAALGRFLCTVAAGLGVEPDFAPVALADGRARAPSAVAAPQNLPAGVAGALRAMASSEGVAQAEQSAVQSAVEAGVRAFLATEIVNLSPPEIRPIEQAPEDPDAGALARVRGGEVDAFEEIVRRNSRRVYRTLVAILGNPEEARDAMQDTFLKAFEHLDSFEHRAKVSTWLTSIASNTGLQVLRERRNIESLDDPGDDDDFRPREVRAWTDDPEEAYARVEMRSLVESTVLKLPAKYRVAVMLRDVEQLPVEEAAAALGLGVPAFKSRLLRGRLMMREALAPHFSEGVRGVSR